MGDGHPGCPLSQQEPRPGRRLDGDPTAIGRYDRSPEGTSAIIGVAPHVEPNMERKQAGGVAENDEQVQVRLVLGTHLNIASQENQCGDPADLGSDRRWRRRIAKPGRVR